MNSIKTAMSHFYLPCKQAEDVYAQHDELVHFANSKSLLSASTKTKFIDPAALPDNIEHLNSKLNEITSAYALLHNFDSEDIKYMGLCHYRRFFKTVTVEKFMASGADILAADPASLGFIGWRHGLEVQYKRAHYADDFELFKAEVRKLPGHDETLFKMWLSAQQLFAPCNLTVMKKDLFKQWLDTLLTVMLPLCSKIDTTRRDNY